MMDGMFGNTTHAALNVSFVQSINRNSSPQDFYNRPLDSAENIGLCVSCTTI